MPVTFSSYRLGPGQRVSNKTVPPPWDWLLRRENELGPRRSKSRIIFAVLVPPLYVAVQAPALIVTRHRFCIVTNCFELVTSVNRSWLFCRRHRSGGPVQRSSRAFAQFIGIYRKLYRVLKAPKTVSIWDL